MTTTALFLPVDFVLNALVLLQFPSEQTRAGVTSTQQYQYRNDRENHTKSTMVMTMGPTAPLR